ncbi:MAG: hypothetical protein AB1420_03015 [Bacillota bacterium]
MRKHILTSFLLLVLLGFLIGGAGMAYFTDKTSAGTPAQFVIGTVEIAGGDIVQSFDEEENCGTVKWTITNTGTKAVKLRAKINHELQGNGGGELVCTGGDTAWAVDYSIVDKDQQSDISPRFGGGNARYNIYNKGYTVDAPFSLKLGAGSNYENTGTVYVWNDTENLCVKYMTMGNWRMTKTHVYVGATAPESNSAQGLGPYKHESLNNVQMDAYTIPLPSYDEIYIAAKADVKSCTGGSTDYTDVEPEIVTTVSGWTEGSDGYYYFCSPVAANQTVDFEMSFCEIGGSWSGEYSVYFEAEAVQASNNAIVSVWGYTCSE